MLTFCQNRPKRSWSSIRVLQHSAPIYHHIALVTPAVEDAVGRDEVLEPGPDVLDQVGVVDGQFHGAHAHPGSVGRSEADLLTGGMVEPARAVQALAMAIGEDHSEAVGLGRAAPEAPEARVGLGEAVEVGEGELHALE